MNEPTRPVDDPRRAAARPARARAAAYLCAAACLALPPLAGCPTDDPPPPLDVDVEVSAHVGTVVTVRWETDAPTTGVVTWGPADDLRTRSSADPATEHEVRLLGNVTDTTYPIEVVALDGDDEVGRFSGEFTTGSLPSELYGIELTVTVFDETRDFGGYFYTPLVTATDAAVVLDRAGDIVWWNLGPDDELRDKRILAVKPSCDGERIDYNRYRLPPDDGRSYVEQVALDGADRTRVDADGHNHTFVELPDGTVAALFDDVVEFGDERIRGDAVIEVAPDGTRRRVWTVFDDFEYEPGSLTTPGTGWSHANALEYDPADDAYYVGIRNFNCIVKVDRASGASEWILGGEQSDFELLDPLISRFVNQHEFQLLDGGIVLFDNGAAGVDASSRALELALDHDAWTAEAVWSYHHDPPVYSAAGGDVWRLDDGNTLVTWGFAGTIDEVTPDGELVWQISAELGVVFFYVTWQEDLYETRLLSCDSE